MEKVILSVTALFLTSATYAENCATSMQGFYAGVNAGLQRSGGKMQYAPNTSPNFARSSIGKNSFIGGVFAGYQMAVGSCTVVGGEVLGNFPTIMKLPLIAKTSQPLLMHNSQVV